MKNTMRRTRRLVIVANRLPFSVARTESGYTYSETTGGLVTGLASYLSGIGSGNARPDEYLWVGWPGSSVDPAGQQEVTAHALRQYHAIPVYLSAEEMDRFYLGFCNKTVWPLFHSFSSYTEYDEQMWQTYRAVNERFRDALLDLVRPDDIVWIHDYQLMLLPLLLRERRPDILTGFFLHIPFPSYEIFRLLPSAWRKEILEGLLGADLIGFHTYEYTQHFLQSVLRILGHGNTLGQILLPQRAVRADTFPMGIDYEHFATATHSPQVQTEIARLRASLGETRVILSADRLDYTKGIINRLRGYDLFLEQHPAWCRKIVLVLVVVPSRTGVDQYDQMKRQLEEHVGRINGKYGTIEWMPVVYQYRYVPFEPLVALYAVSDVAMVTPLRDGMNLVAKEYIACRTNDNGVLILSELAGAAKELGEAVLVNPNHAGEIAAAIKTALTIAPEEQTRRLRIMQARLQRYTVHRWATDFVEATLGAVDAKPRSEPEGLSRRTMKPILDEYRRSTRRLILLDYDGTLVPFVADPATASPPPKVLSLVRTLSGDLANTVVIISGRDRHTLATWFDGLPVHLFAEHGCFAKAAGTEWRSDKPIVSDWKERLRPILHRFADRLPGSSVEEKEFSLVWHYRASDPDQGDPFAHEIVDNLNAMTGNIDVQVVQANKAIEVRVMGVNKGTAARAMIAEGAYDFILAIGDDRTDEDLFAVLPEPAHSVKVGTATSQAKYHCQDVDDVHALLAQLIAGTRERRTFSEMINRTFRMLARITGGTAPRQSG